MNSCSDSVKKVSGWNKLNSRLKLDDIYRESTAESNDLSTGKARSAPRSRSYKGTRGRRFFVKLAKHTVCEVITEKLYQIMLYMFYLQSMSFRVTRLPSFGTRSINVH